MPSELKTQRQGSTLVLTLSDPATRNTLSEQLVSAGIEALNVAESDAEVRAVIVRGEGAHFCAGADLRQLQSRRRSDIQAQADALAQLHQWIEALHAFPKPLIAAVEGAAAGAGFSLALACDLIVGAEDARFIVSHAQVGLTPEGGATWQLMRSLPRQLVQQWVWLAEPLGARELQAHGLVNAVTASGQALDEALRLAERLAMMAPNAVACAKELLRQASGADLVRQLQTERDHFMTNLVHPNAEEGLQAFFDKRSPRFQ